MLCGVIIYDNRILVERGFYCKKIIQDKAISQPEGSAYVGEGILDRRSEIYFL